MALRIDKAVVSGWIDNTTPGVIHGGIQLLGIQRPIKLELRGNGLRDIAGTRIDFKNPHPQAQEEVIGQLHHLQKGVAGDMTASKKIHTPTHQVKNALSLEWFSLTNGRVLIETTQYKITISNHHWEFDAAGELQQRLENANTMEHFMELMLTASAAQSEVQEIEGEVDEFEWEKRLRVRDHLEEAAWFLSEGQNQTDGDAFEVEEISLKNRKSIVQHAIIVQSKALDLLGDSMIDEGPRNHLALSTAYIFDTLDETWPEKAISLEKGYVLAVLKRTLEACNTAIAACNTLAMEDDQFEDLRSHIFHLRDLITDTSHTLRKHQNPEES